MTHFHSSSRCGAFSARTIAVILCLLVCLTVALPARAGGIYANEYGTPEMGTAGAGAEASALDASTGIPFDNPAGMTNLEGDQVIVAAGAPNCSAPISGMPRSTPAACLQTSWGTTRATAPSGSPPISSGSSERCL